jgi:hypothetical protein
MTSLDPTYAHFSSAKPAARFECYATIIPERILIDIVIIRVMKVVHWLLKIVPMPFY